MKKLQHLSQFLPGLSTFMFQAAYYQNNQLTRRMTRKGSVMTIMTSHHVNFGSSYPCHRSVYALYGAGGALVQVCKYVGDVGGVAHVGAISLPLFSSCHPVTRSARFSSACEGYAESVKPPVKGAHRAEPASHLTSQHAVKGVKGVKGVFGSSAGSLMQAV